jgi:hypothetical protein
MRVDLFLTVASPKEALHFYVEELALFELRLDYGMDTYLISYKANPTVCLSIGVGEEQVRNKPTFALEVKDCLAEYQRISKIDFTKGGILKNNGNDKQIFEYPLGKSFLMQDPFGNRFLIIEGY